MALQEVNQELAAAHSNAGAQEAQASTMIRFGGGLHVIRRHIVVEAQFESLEAATWLQATITKHYQHRAEMIQVSRPDMAQMRPRYSVRVIKEGGVFALQTHLMQLTRVVGQARPIPMPVRGLPINIESADQTELIGALRGAFMAGAQLSDPERASSLEFPCPGEQSARDLMKILQHLGFESKMRRSRSALLVSLHNPTDIEHLLTQIGAPQAASEWGSQRLDGVSRGKANRLANFDDANMRRSVEAAVAARAKVKHAFEVLGDEVPDTLRIAGELRLKYRSASLEELGQAANPPLTKDAVAGRLRRLLQLSTKVEKERAKQQRENESA